MPGRRCDSLTSGDPPARPSDPAVAQGEHAPHRPALPPRIERACGRLGLIVFSAALGVVSPFLLREVLDVAIPQETWGC